MLLQLGQGVVLRLKAAGLRLFPAKGPDDPHAGQVLPGVPQHPVQAGLHLFVPGHGPQHDAEHHHRQQGDRHYKDQRRGHIDGKGHHHGPKHHKGGAQQQPQGQVQAVLHLVDVTGHAGDQGGGARRIHLCKAQLLNMGKQSVAQLGRHPHRGLCGKKLGRNRAHQPNDAQGGHHQAHAPNVPPVPVGDAHVDDGRHHQGDHQLKRGLQQLEQRPQNAFLFVVLHIGEQAFHKAIVPFHQQIGLLYHKTRCITKGELHKGPGRFSAGERFFTEAGAEISYRRSWKMRRRNPSFLCGLQK